MERIKKIWKIINTGYFAASFFLVIGFIGTYRSCTVKEKGVYTIATVYNITTGKSGRDFGYTYTYMGKKYKKSGTASYVYMSDEGARFFVQILSDDPERHWLHDIRVPDSITEAPYEGWKELPIPVQE